MILSSELIFSEAQNLTSTGASTNIIDLGANGTPLGAPTSLVRDIGKGKPVPILVQLTADASGTSPTLDVALQVDDNTGFSSAKTVMEAQQVAGGSDGDRVWLWVVPEETNERYMRLNYTLGGTSPNYTLTAAIVASDQTNP